MIRFANDVRSSAFRRSGPSSILHPPSSLLALFSFLLPLAFCLHTSAAQQAWVAKYSNGPGSTNPPAGIGLDKDGNVYVAGASTRSTAPHDLDYLVLKYSPLGSPLWTNRFGSLGVDERVRAMAMIADGDVFITGTTNTIKYLPSGLLAWTAPYAGSDIKVDTNGNVYVTGFRTDAYSTVKLDPNGSNVWLRLWDPGQWEDISQKIAVDAAGNVFVLGLTTDLCDRVLCYRQPWVIKYNALGELLWTKPWAQPSYTHLSEYKGGSCHSTGDLYFVARLHEAVLGRFRSLVVKILANGEHPWSRSFHSAPYIEGVLAVDFDRNVNIYCTGLASSSYDTHKFNSDGTNLWKARYAPLPGSPHQGNGIAADSVGNAYVTGQSPGVGTGNDYATIKYGTNGQQLWVKRFTEAGNSDDQAHAIAVSPNGDVYVTGFSNPSPGTYEITTIKYIQVSPIEKKSNGNILLSFCGAPGSNYVIEATSTLTNWTDIGTTTADPSGLYTFEDTNAPAFQQRFYRTKQE